MNAIFTSGVKPRSGQTGYQLLGNSYRPTTGDVLSAGFRSGLEGEGSAIQDVATSVIAAETGQDTGVIQEFSNVLNTGLFGLLSPEEVLVSKPLTEDEWKAGPYFREDLKYTPGMTTRAAAILSNTRDRKVDRDFVISRAEGFAQNAAFWTGGFVGAMADAKNVTVSVAASAATPLIVGGLAAGPKGAAGGAIAAGGVGFLAGAARVVPSLLRLSRVGVDVLKTSRAVRVSAVLGEAVVSTVPSVVTGVQNAPIVQQKYDAGDATLDLLASAGLGVAFHGVSEAAGAAWRRYASPNDAIDLGHMVTQQVAAGEKIDVEPLVHQKLADYVPEVASVEFTPRFVQEGGSGKRIRFRAEQDVYGEVLTSRVFNDKKAAEADLKEQFLARSVQVAKELGLPPEQLAQLEAVAQIRARVRTFDGEKMATELVDRTPAVTRAKEKLAVAEQKLAEAKPKKQASRQRGVEAARQELEAARQAERPLMLQAAQAEKAKLQGLLSVADNTIRDLQRKSAAARLPQYAKAQLDMSPEGRAARSIDPRAVEVERDRLPASTYNEDAPLPPLEEQAMAELRELAKSEPTVAKYLEGVEQLKKLPDAIIQFAKCKGGR